MPPTFTYSLQGVAPNQYLRLTAIGGEFEPNYDLVLNTDIWPGDGQTYDVKEISGNSMFMLGYVNLVSVTMNNLEIINGNRTFSDCIRLTYVNVSSLKTITGTQTFRSCNGLTYINLSNLDGSLNVGTFVDCNILKTCILGNITDIGDYAFVGCVILKNLYINILTAPTIGTDVFLNNSALTYIFVPTASTWTGTVTSGKTVTLQPLSLPSTTQPTASVTPSSVTLQTTASTPNMPGSPGEYTVPYYTYKWYKNNVLLSSTTSSQPISTSFNDTYTVKAVDPLNQESTLASNKENVIIGINYVKFQ